MTQTDLSSPHNPLRWAAPVTKCVCLRGNLGKTRLLVGLQDDLFEWHFTIRGPPDTEFEGGVYHGRILLPSEYPVKPPDIIILTVRWGGCGGERPACVDRVLHLLCLCL